MISQYNADREAVDLFDPMTGAEMAAGLAFDLSFCPEFMDI